MSVLLYAVCAYLGIGALAVVIFDAVTHRVRQRFSRGVSEVQSITLAGAWLSRVLLALAVWVFWVALFVGALRGSKDV